MKMTKKVLAAGMAAVMAVSMAGCGGKTEPSGASTPAAQAPADTKAEEKKADNGGGAEGSSEMPKITMSIGHNGNMESLNQYVAEQVKALLEEKSGGNITVNIYPNAQLGSESDMLTSCQEGDLTFLVSGMHALVNTIPAGAIVDIPFLYDDVNQARAAFSDPTVRELLNRDHEKVGLKMVLLADQGFRCLTSNKEIKTADDVTGLNIRTLTNPDQVEFWKMLGANPTPIDFSELYLSLQQGVIDSQENPYNIINDNKLYEVQKYFTNSNHVYHTVNMLVGTKTYDALPDVYKELVAEVCTEVEKMACEEADRTLDTFKQNLIDNGMVYIDFNELGTIRADLKAKTDGIVDVVKKTCQDDELVDAYLKAVEAAVK